MARPEKVAAVAEIRDRLTESDAAVLTEYRGLKVSELADLRGALRPAGTEFKIYKNTLARRAAEEAGLGELVPMLEGPTAIAFVKGDAVIAAKALRDFGRTNQALIVKGGLLGDKFLAPAEIAELADVPPRDVLLARLAGGLQAPLAKAANLFGALQRKTAYAFQALIDQRVAAGETLDAPAPAPDDAPEAPAEKPTPEASDAAPAESAESSQSASPAQAADDSTAVASEAAAETDDAPAESE